MAISEDRKKQLRAEMLRRWKQKLRRKGASKAAGGDSKKAGGTGSMKGFSWTKGAGKEEREYIKTVRAAQKATGKITTAKGKVVDKKKVAKKVRKIGAGSTKLVTAMSMKNVKSGGTVSRGSHKAVAGQKGGGAKRIAAKAWRTKHMAAAGTDKARRRKIQKRFKHMIGK
jgi:hypothetical protein